MNIKDMYALIVMLSVVSSNRNASVKIAKETGHSRNTIRKALKNEIRRYNKRDHQPFPILEPYIKIIDKWFLKIRYPKKQRHTAQRNYYRLIHEHSFAVAESKWRNRSGGIEGSQICPESQRPPCNERPQAFISLTTVARLEIEDN